MSSGLELADARGFLLFFAGLIDLNHCQCLNGRIREGVYGFLRVVSKP